MEHSIEILEFLLLIAAIVAMVARQVRLPYSIGLVLTGVALSLVPHAPQIQFSRELIFTVLLPPLVFEAALYIRWQELANDLAAILTLASVGVLLAALVTTIGFHFFLSWDWRSALVFGLLIAATDPVSVIAAFKESRARGRLRFIIEAESLFNDGTAAAAFAITIAFSSGVHVTSAEVVKTSLVMIGGGTLLGAAVAAGVLLLAHRTTDHLVETALTTITAYGSFLLAEYFGSSGVLATLAAGLIIGNVGLLGPVSDKGRETVITFWEFAAFVANSLIFLLMGMNGTKENFILIWRTVLVAIPIVLVSRAAGVYLTLFPFRWSSSRVSIQQQHVLVWGGLRGALALALALSIPDTVARRHEILTVTFAIVAFSVLIQGTTVVPMLRRLGQLPNHLNKN